MLDYILFNEAVSRKVRYYEILDEGAISSTSDHLPVIVDVMIDSMPHRVLDTTKKSPAWHKISEIQISEYQDLLGEALDCLTEKISSDCVDIDSAYHEFVSIVHTTADKCIPKCGFNPYTKPYWNHDVKEAHTNERRMRNIWVDDGRPRGMQFESYKAYKRAKSEFRRIQQAANEQYVQNCYDDINNAAECDVRLFWKLVKRFKPSSSKIYPEIVYHDKICSTPETVADCFADYFCDLYHPSDYDFYDTDTKRFVETIYNDIVKN